ncbi:hypothetical protein [Streptomyces sp. RKAG337]|uniref:hypothetical protein n=1 Tax=Streptomyces sp. RKAG337 TaxID=2893404 RepID=UPI00203377DA|nr:hypothetical protein [Streptomyces sp. RKAG337]MCM2427674.1 hypothetical protein [Streptomyces sp. RKAG337]
MGRKIDDGNALSPECQHLARAMLSLYRDLHADGSTGTLEHIATQRLFVSTGNLSEWLNARAVPSYKTLLHLHQLAEHDAHPLGPSVTWADLKALHTQAQASVCHDCQPVHQQHANDTAQLRKELAAREAELRYATTATPEPTPPHHFDVHGRSHLHAVAAKPLPFMQVEADRPLTPPTARVAELLTDALRLRDQDRAEDLRTFLQGIGVLLLPQEVQSVVLAWVRASLHDEAETILQAVAHAGLPRALQVMNALHQAGMHHEIGMILNHAAAANTA